MTFDEDALRLAAEVLAGAGLRGEKGVQGPMSEESTPVFKAEGEFIPAKYEDITITLNPETGFPELPKGHWWRVTKEIHPDLGSDALRVSLMRDEKVLDSNWSVYAGGYSGMSILRCNPTREAIVGICKRLYKSWAFGVMWDKAMEAQVGEFGRD